MQHLTPILCMTRPLTLTLSPKGERDSVGQPAVELAFRGRGTKEEDENDSDKTLSLMKKIAVDLR